MIKKLNFAKETKKIIEEIEKQNIVVKPKDLVNKARPENSPLHSYFIWDDGKAGEAYRRNQAAQLIAKVRVIYKNNEARGFQKVKVIVGGEKEKEGYVSTAKILSNEDLRKQVITIGLNELYGWKSKYSVYEELMKLIRTDKMERLRNEKSNS